MFITLEGIEGAGKTTQIDPMVRFLESRGHTCVVTREPGGTRIGRKIRAILLDPDSSEMSPLTELLLYAADRAQHVERLVKPALAEGKTVICDRHFDATTVYQGYARGLIWTSSFRCTAWSWENCCRTGPCFSTFRPGWGCRVPGRPLKTATDRCGNPV